MFDRLAEFLLYALLLNKHLCGGDITIHEVRAFHHYLVFKFDELVWIFHPEHFLQQF